MKKCTKWLRYLFRTIETLVAFVIVVVSLVLYQLHDSPMDAQFLMQELEKTLLPTESGYHLEAESVILGSDLKKEGLIQIEIQDLKIVRADGSEAIVVPQARLAYDFWHIITLNYIPSTILVQNSQIDLFLSDTGDVVVEHENSSTIVDETKVKQFIGQLLSFRHIDIQNSTLHFQDKKTQQDFLLSHLNLHLSQRFQVREKIHFDADLSYAGQTTRVLFDGAMNRLTKKMDVKIGLPSVYLKPLGKFLPILSGMDFSAQISMKGQLDLRKSHFVLSDIVDKLNFQIKSTTPGTLNLPDPLTNLYDIIDLKINGVLTDNCHLLKIDESVLTLKNGTTATLETQIQGIKAFLKSGDLKHLKTDFTSHVVSIKTNEIAKVWPRGVGTSTHDWVATHLSKGDISQADFTLHFVGDELVDLYGDIQAEGVQVDYLPPMPPVQGVKARVELFPTTVQIHVFDGYVDSLNVAGTEMLFTDVDIDPSWANVQLKAKGKVADVFRLLSYKPLEFTQEYKINADKAKGQANLETELFFKLDTESEPDEVKVKTKAEIKNGYLVLGEPAMVLDHANLSLNLTNQKMEVQGLAEVFEMPLSVKWVEYFEPTQDIKATYDLEGAFSTNYLKDLYPDIEKFILGKMSLAGHFKRFTKDNTFSGDFQVDTQDSKVNFYPLGQVKQVGQPCLVKGSFQQPDSKNIKMDLSMAGKMGNKNENFDIQGQFLFGPTTSIKFSKIMAPETDISLDYQKSDTDLKVEILGAYWNASKFLQMPMDIFPDMVSDDLVRNVSVSVKLDKVIFNAENPIQNVLVQGKRQGPRWDSFHAQADLKEPFILIFDKKARQFQGAYQDFGNLMASLGFKTNILDGSLTLTADEQDNGEIKGKVLIQNLKLKDPGFLTQALTILGVLDAFMGKDLVFDQVEIPATLDLKNNIFIQDGLARGTNLGITFKGKVDDNLLDIQGSLVPAYALNSLPGKLPIVGWLFKNTEGGGVINLPFTITGPFGNPSFELHPLGTMKPGFLGNIFE